MAGCSGAQGLAFADGTTRPAAPASSATVPSPNALLAPTASPTPTGDLVVTGAPKGVLAKGGVLADATTGQVLWNRGMDVERPMASITKVMTAYLVISAGNVDRKITIPKGVLDYVAKYGASSDSLKPGEVLTVRQLLYGLLLESGADAAYTLAVAYGPGLGAFIAKMNAIAQQLGMLHTHFTSPDGLPYPTETSTYSTNGLIGNYPGAVGIKTGYTDVALHCLLFEAVRNGRTLIGVVLGSPATGPQAGAADATRVLDWGFALKKV